MAKTENGMNRRQFEQRGGRRGFTLIELLVVVAIIALLISILLPSLQGARRSARATVCATNLHHVAQAVNIYLAENNAVYPPSYVYPLNGQGAWDPVDQPPNRDFGYVHWSWMLYNRGQAGDGAFQCPEILNGGHPRTNPGPNDAFWEGGQVDDGGTTPAGNDTAIEDKQAPRLAFTGNAAIFPRNKFTTGLTSDGEGNARVNVFVRESAVKSARPVILATEFQKKFTSVCQFGASAGGLKSKSHRPINPFRHIGAGAGGTDEYSATAPGFVYKQNPNAADTPQEFNLLPQSQIENITGLIEGGAQTELNAVGRHHPGGDKLGGTTNFLYVDGSVQRKTVYSTLEGREWGNRFYSIDRFQEILDMQPPN